MTNQNIAMFKPFLQRRPKIQTPEKPPNAKPLRSRNIPDNDPKTKVNASYRHVPPQFKERPKRRRRVNPG